MFCSEKMLLSFTIFVVSLSGLILSLNIEELKPINYEVDLQKTPVKREEDKTSAVVYVKSTFGQEYQCMLPDIEEEEFLEKDTQNEKNTDIAELLKPMKAGSCLLKGKDWWTYEFCFGHYIKQFHIEDGQILGSVITLGFYDSDYDWNNETNQEKFKHVKQRYHSQFYVNGTKCDLTGQPRNAEVRLFCEEDAGDYIHRVDEPGTCSYIITIHSSRLCAHPQLKPLPSKKAQSIPCNPVLEEEQYSIYSEKLNVKKQKAEQTISEWLSNQQELLQVMKNGKLQIHDDGENSEDIMDVAKIVETTRDFQAKVLSKALNEMDETSLTDSEGSAISESTVIETFTFQDYDRDPDSVTIETRDEPLDDYEDDYDMLSDDESTILSKETSKNMSPDDETDADEEELQVRIRRLDRKSNDPDGKLYEMDFGQRKKLEKAVKDKLEKSGLDTGGSRRIEVKIITAGYYETEEGKDLDMLSEEETLQFQNMIMSLLTGQQEAVQEVEKQRKLEENYKFIYEEDDYIDE